MGTEFWLGNLFEGGHLKPRQWWYWNMLKEF